MKGNSTSNVYWLLRQWRNRMAKEYGVRDFRVQMLNAKISRIGKAITDQWVSEQEAA